MICCSKLGQGLDIGGFVIRGAMIGHEDHQKARAPGRDRIGGFEITRNVPDEVWERWYYDNRNGPIVQRKLVMGFLDGDDQALNEFCWANAKVRGWQQASQDGSTP